MKGEKLAEWAEDYIQISVNIRFCWFDRLRILFHGKCDIELKTDCEKKPGRIDSYSIARIPRVFRRRKLESAEAAKPVNQ
tara:strand:- start:1540 stop:1779 length:240 start_codon:yes stop_codon:yes gene_type:complete